MENSLQRKGSRKKCVCSWSNKKLDQINKNTVNLPDRSGRGAPQPLEPGTGGKHLQEKRHRLLNSCSLDLLSAELRTRIVRLQNPDPSSVQNPDPSSDPDSSNQCCGSGFIFILDFRIRFNWNDFGLIKNSQKSEKKMPYNNLVTF